jgi:hypothetical protein
MDALQVRLAFSAYIESRRIPEDKKLFLKNHERRGLAERNCLEQVWNAQRTLKNRFNKEKLELLVTTAAQLFCDLAIKKKIEDLMTPAEKARCVAKAGELQDTQRMVDEMAKEAMSTASTKSMWVPGAGKENQ